MSKRMNVQSEIATIGDLSREQLCQRWQKIYGHQPPKGVRRELMIRAVAWHLQAKRLGGFSAETRRLLRSAVEAAEIKLADAAAARTSAAGIACGHSSEDIVDNGNEPGTGDHRVVAYTAARTSRPSRSPKTRAGARLLRDWNGKTHVVDVIEGGFVFEAKVYASLSAIARTITGAHWSGPRFFGL